MAVLALPACLEDSDLDDRLFPCRAPEDCIEGFECHPERFVCVRPGESTDAGTLDGGD